MARTINPIRKEKVKQEYKRNGGNAYKALKAGGLAESTAKHSVMKKNTLLNIVKAEILQELKESDITAEMVINRLNEDKQLAIAKKDIATAVRVDELLGRYIAMFTDKQQIDANLVSKEEDKLLNKYIPLNRLANIPVGALNNSSETATENEQRREILT